MIELVKRRRRSAWEFLVIPALIVIGFVLLAEVVDWLDNHAGPRQAWGPFRLWLSQYVGDTQAAIGVLSAIAGSLFTVTSLTFSILLLAVQQGATVLNSQIVDHYLRRRSNRAWFGFFVGVSLFVLITLVQTTHTASPVLGVMVSTFMGALALVALVVLIYATVDQTRPMTVINDIVEAAMTTRQLQMPMLAATAPVSRSFEGFAIRSVADGYIVAIDRSALERALAGEPEAMLSLDAPIGTFLAVGVPFARHSGAANAARLEREVLGAITLHEQRQIEQDAAYSLDHIATIGWTAISTAHSDPAVGAIVVHALQRLLHAWAVPPRRAEGASSRIFYNDPVFEQVLDSVESLMVAATESRQHQTLALIVQSLSATLPTLPPSRRKGIFRLVRTLSASLTGHLPTRSLCAALTELAATYRALGASAEADELRGSLAHLFLAAGEQ